MTSAYSFFAAPDTADAVPIHTVDTPGFDAWLGTRPGPEQTWLKASGFKPDRHRYSVLPGDDGDIAGVVLGLGSEAAIDDPFLWGGLAANLPAGLYRPAATLTPRDARLASLGWALGRYQFSRYRAAENGEGPRLVLPDTVAVDELNAAITAHFLVRDLVNTPANDMGPAELADAAKQLAKEHGARFSEVVGDALIEENYPAIHAVGRASSRAPRLLDLKWGDENHPKLTLVGKGVCFDSGGLDIKNAAGMRIMKKDMGGGAHALALAAWIMGTRLPVRLRVLVPAVENSIAGNAYRPGDILKTRKGLSVEVENTDAEGRTVLCDALAAADEDHPDLILDFTTLTGSARVALGPDLPALFTSDDALAEAFTRHGGAETDPVWRLPLWQPYKEYLDSKVADIVHASSGPFAGAITAALFLQRFVENAGAWAHLDLYAWNQKAKPGRPEGGEAMALRAAYALIAERYGGGSS